MVLSWTPGEFRKEVSLRNNEFYVMKKLFKIQNLWGKRYNYTKINFRFHCKGIKICRKLITYVHDITFPLHIFKEMRDLVDMEYMARLPSENNHGQALHNLFPHHRLNSFFRVSGGKTSMTSLTFDCMATPLTHVIEMMAFLNCSRL